MKKNILAIMLSALCVSSVYQVDAQHGLETIQKSYKKLLTHVVIDVIGQIKEEKNIHDQFFIEINRELVAWRDFWKKEVSDFCETQKSCKLTEDEFYKKLSQDKTKFYLSKELIDLGYVLDEDELHPVAQEAFSCIALTLRKLTVLTSGYFLPPEERIERGITGKHFDVNLEICIKLFEDLYSRFFKQLLNYIVEDGFEEKNPDQMIEDINKIFKIKQDRPKSKTKSKPKKVTFNLEK